MGETIEVVARIQATSKETLETLSRLCGLSLATYSGQVLDNQVVAARAARIQPSLDHTAMTDDESQEEDEDRKPRHRLSKAEERELCEIYENENIRGPALAKRFGISMPTVYRVLSRRQKENHND